MNEALKTVLPIRRQIKSVEEHWLNFALPEDEMKKELIDSSDIVVVFENIRCVVDAETEVVLGTIPFV